MHKLIECLRSDGDELMANRDAPLTEPQTIQCLYVSGVGIEITDNVVRFVGWSHLPALGADMEERRIVVRFAMSNRQAKNFEAVLRKGLIGGRH